MSKVVKKRKPYQKDALKKLSKKEIEAIIKAPQSKSGSFADMLVEAATKSSFTPC